MMKGLGKNHLFNQMWIHEITSLLYNVWGLNLDKKVNKLKPYIHKVTL
jgi:hypothetical protein